MIRVTSRLHSSTGQNVFLVPLITQADTDAGRVHENDHCWRNIPITLNDRQSMRANVFQCCFRRALRLPTTTVRTIGAPHYKNRGIRHLGTAGHHMTMRVPDGYSVAAGAIGERAEHATSQHACSARRSIWERADRKCS
jgi:hypothetical protein